MNESIMSNPVVIQIILETVYQFFFVFGLIGIAVGIGLVVSHARMQQFSSRANQWVSMRRSTKWLAIPRDSGAAERRFRYLLGAVFVLLPAFTLFVLVTKIDGNRLAAALHLAAAYPNAAMLLESVRWILIAGSVLAVAVGVMLLFFPRALQAVEARTNRWYSTRNMTRGGEVGHFGFDAWVAGHPRAVGLVIALGALFVTAHFGMLLFQRG